MFLNVYSLLGFVEPLLSLCLSFLSSRTISLIIRFILTTPEFDVSRAVSLIIFVEILPGSKMGTCAFLWAARKSLLIYNSLLYNVFYSRFDGDFVLELILFRVTVQWAGPVLTPA